MRFNRTFLLFFIIFLEGYVVLASELLAIRLLIPYVGSGTEVIAIIISAVLLPLAFGYHWGGGFAERLRLKNLNSDTRFSSSIRKKLVQNLTISLLILTFGLSYVVHELLFGILYSGFHIESVIIQTTVYCVLFLVYPIFLLGQTVPLVSNYFAKRQLSKMTGRMLCFSTTGSFAGSVITTVVLMMTIGVHNTVILVLAGITLMIFMLEKTWFTFKNMVILAVFAFGFFINNDTAMKKLHVVSNNAYNVVQVFEADQGQSTVFAVNRSTSSLYSENRDLWLDYLKHVRKQAIDPIEGEKKEILVIGAGGFTLGLNDDTNHYTYVDIDPDLQKVAEATFLPEKLGDNVTFVPMSARAFYAQSDKKFDFILLDAFTNTISLPLECTTQEFFQETKDHLKEGGIVAANIISRPDFSDKFTVRIHNTFASVFPVFTRQVVQDYNAWNSEVQYDKSKQKIYYANIVYWYYDRPEADDRTIYTDDKTTYSYDKELF